MDPVTKMTRIVQQTLMGVIAGIAANRITRTIDGGQNDKKTVFIAFTKLITIGIFLMVLERQFPGMAEEWQSTTPGLFFVSFFFGLQTNVINHMVAIRNHYLRDNLS